MEPAHPLDASPTPAVALSLLVTSICLFLSYNKAPAKPSTDFVAETVSMIQMAVLNE